MTMCHWPLGFLCPFTYAISKPILTDKLKFFFHRACMISSFPQKETNKKRKKSWFSCIYLKLFSVYFFQSYDNYIALNFSKVVPVYFFPYIFHELHYHFFTNFFIYLFCVILSYTNQSFKTTCMYVHFNQF